MLARLRVADHPVAFWTGAVEPWLREHGTNWRERRALLVPNTAWVAALKAAAVEAGIPAMGVDWHTPGRWRALATRGLPGPAPRIALREDLHLLLELAAAHLPDNPLARAYGQDPAPFQQLLDTLESAGWDADVLPDPAARELAEEAAKLCARTGWVTSAAADNRLREAARAGKVPPLGRRLLAVGFGPADWPLRSLLETACAAYGETELILDVVDAAQPPAAAWVGSWEQFAGRSADWLEAAEVAAPFAPLGLRILSPAISRDTSSLPQSPHLWLAEDLQGEADLVAAQALKFLATAGDVPPRIGIVVGSLNSPLAREVAARLVALGLPHHDSPGHLPGRSTAQMLFDAWLDWQENGRLAGLVAWARAAQQHGLLGADAAKKIEKSLREAMAATLADDPAMIAPWLESADAPEAREFLSAWPRLPESAAWEKFIEIISTAAQKFGWPSPPEVLSSRADAWTKALTGPAPRACVLRWVRAVTRVPGRTRDALGREPFAPLQIIEAASAAAYPWTHLVLGGLQHGEWPASDWDSPLLDEARINALNRQVLKQGSQGEGHSIATPGRGLLLSQADRRRLDRAAFARLAGLPASGLALTSRRADPTDGRPARFSEYFWAAARAVLGRLPSESDWESLAATSCAARDEFQKISGAHSVKTTADENIPGAAQTARAYSARRDATTPFDEYSFCLQSPPVASLRLSCKDWENAVGRPGATWFAKVLRVEPRWDPATDDCVRLSLGTWAHQFVRPGPAATESFAPPGVDLWQKIAADRAEQMRLQVAAAFAKAGKPVAESWLDAWAAAGRVAAQWISALADLPEWPQALAEMNLPPSLQAKLPALDIALPLSGRMDLVLWPHTVKFSSGDLRGAEAWVLDFKSGQDKSLSVKKLAAGEGLQLALYALALSALGAGAVSLTLLNRDAEAEPQLASEDLERPELSPLWHLLADFSRAGRWGERRDLADRFAAAGDYPSATLPVPGEILRRKWALTHEFPA